MRDARLNTKMEERVSTAYVVKPERIGLGIAAAGTLFVLLLLPLFFVASLIYVIVTFGLGLYAAAKRKKKHREWAPEKLKYIA
jgi:hypothetical protein